MDQIELLDRLSRILLGTAAEVLGLRQRLLGYDTEIEPRRKRAARKVGRKGKRIGRPPKAKPAAAPVKRVPRGVGRPGPERNGPPKRRGRPPKNRPDPLDLDPGTDLRSLGF